MTREQAIAAAPSSRREYWGSFLSCTVISACTILLAAAVKRRPPIDLSVFAVTLALIAAQSAERLFYPVRAAQRSEAFSPIARKCMLGAKLFCSVTFYGLCAVILLAFVVNSPSWFGFNVTSTHRWFDSDLTMFMFPALFLISFLRDLLGEKSYWQTFKRAESLSIADFKL